MPASGDFTMSSSVTRRGVCARAAAASKVAAARPMASDACPMGFLRSQGSLPEFRPWRRCVPGMSDAEIAQYLRLEVEAVAGPLRRRDHAVHDRHRIDPQVVG